MKRKIRKTDFLIGLLLTFSLGFITSCAGFFSRYSTDEPEDIPLLENGNVYVSFNVNEMFSRTVLPTVTLSQYTYKLEAKQSGVVKKTVSPYTLASKVELPLGIYDFTLTGSKNSKDIVSGNLSGIDLTSKSKNLTFSLKPLTGNKGSAEITLIIPQTGVSKVKSGISTSLTAEPVTETPVSSFTLSNGKYRRNFTYSNTLNSAVTQFAVFKVYDSKGGLVASRTESLLIVGGCTSSATIEITANDFHTYTPAITVTKNG